MGPLASVPVCRPLVLRPSLTATDLLFPKTPRTCLMQRPTTRCAACPVLPRQTSVLPALMAAGRMLAFPRACLCICALA